MENAARSEELAAQGITLAVARRKRSLEKFFEREWVNARKELTKDYTFTTLKSAIYAFERRAAQDSTPGSG